jgi:hypothetical protein
MKPSTKYFLKLWLTTAIAGSLILQFYFNLTFNKAGLPMGNSGEKASFYLFCILLLASCLLTLAGITLAYLLLSLLKISSNNSFSSKLTFGAITSTFMFLLYGYYVFNGNFDYINFKDLKLLFPLMLSLILALAVFKIDEDVDSQQEA